MLLFVEVLEEEEAAFPSGKLNQSSSEQPCAQLTAAAAVEEREEAMDTVEVRLRTSLLMTEYSVLIAAESSPSWLARDTCLTVNSQ